MESPRLHAFLEAIREYPNITRAAKAARIKRSAHYERYKRDKAYAVLFDDAWRAGVGRVRDVAMDRILHGIEEPVIYQGRYQVQKVEVRGKKVERLVTVRKFPERLHMAVLRGEMPETYNRQKIELEHSGTVTAVIQRLQAARRRIQPPPENEPR